MTADYKHMASGLARPAIDSDYDLQCRLRINDASALWDVASAKAMTYPDMTAETVVEMIGLREDPDIAECLLLLLHPAIAGCELVTLSCTAGTTGGAIPAPVAETKQRSATVAIGAARPPSFLRTWKARAAAEFPRAVRGAE